MRRLPGGGAPCAQYQRSHWFHIARVGLVENPRRVGSGGHADSEQTHVPRAGSAVSKPNFAGEYKIRVQIALDEP